VSYRIQLSNLQTRHILPSQIIRALLKATVLSTGYNHTQKFVMVMITLNHFCHAILLFRLRPK